MKRALKPSTLRIGTRYRASRLKNPYDAIVIGSGIGGLTTAACLAKQGQKVLVLEQHYTAGGFTHSYTRDNYEWDVGVHYIGDMGSPNTLGRKLFDEITDGELKWAPMDANYDRFYIGDEQFDLFAGKDAFLEKMTEYFPEERAALEKYLKMLNKVANGMQYYTLSKLMPRFTSPLVNGMLKVALPSYFNKTTYEVLSGLTKNEKLIGVLTGQWGDCGMTPKQSSFMIHSLIAKHYIYGGYYPIGGASRMAETIIPVIERAGGNVFTYADVAEIIIEKGKAVGVKMVDGEQIYAPAVISNAGVFNTYDKLLPQAARKRIGFQAKRKHIKPSMANVGMFIGINETAESLGLPRTNFWIYPDEHHDANVTNFLGDPEGDFPVVYISFPSAKDPSYSQRHPGTATIEIVAPTHNAIYTQWQDSVWGKRGDDYEAYKEQLAERMLSYLYAKLPQVKGKIAYYEVSTPLTTNFFCAYQHGEIYGLEHDPERFRQDWLRPTTPIKGLYLTGQDILSCGVVGAMIAGMLTTVAMQPKQSLPLLKKLFIERSKTAVNGKVIEAIE